jgi:hypothetical protein
MNFADAIQNELNESYNVARSENGALGYRTTTSHLLDMNFAISSLRHKSDSEIQKMFSQVFYEDKILACRFLFYLRDAREGSGERRSFRICFKWLADNEPNFCKALIPLVAEYGRYDDLWVLLDTQVKDEVVTLVKKQLTEDAENLAANKPISLLAKWMPSEQGSSKTTKRYAEIFRTELNCTHRHYRKMISKMREYLKIVERDMSAKKWGEIDYNSVPSRANLIYNNAFLRNDEERRRNYLSKLASGDKSVKINAGVLFPHDIVGKYTNNGWYSKTINNYDETLEQLWKNLNDTVGGASNIMVVADSSGSMTCRVDPHSNISAMTVANALAIYFSERCNGQFKDKYITFSSRPQWVDLSNCKSLHDKLAKAYGYNIVEDTNIEKTFDLILKTAIDNHMSQEDMPQTVLVISDMEFNCGTCGRPDMKLFQNINQKFEDAGYHMPRLVFWNVNSRSGAIPVKSNGNGFPCALVSGFSTNVVKMVLSNELDPLKALLDVLNADRYQAVEKAVKELA